MVMVANGLANYFDAEQRVLEVTDSVYSAFGDEYAAHRRPLESAKQALGFST